MKKNSYITIIILIFLVVIYITAKSGVFDSFRNSTSTQNNSVTINKSKGMKITSPAFVNNTKIPSKYTCNGNNVNPPLIFEDVPHNAKSLVLIVDDPDAPMGTWVHWVVYNINPKAKDVAENSIPQDGIQAVTSFAKPGYGGPCPPSGTHRYFFKLYALDTILHFDETQAVDKKAVEDAMNSHIVDQTEFIGLYSQQK